MTSGRPFERFGSSRRHNLLGVAVHRTVFLAAAAVILGLVVLGVVAPRRLESGATFLREAIATNLGWFYLLCMNTFLVFAVYLIFSRFGSLRLGGEDSRPEFTYWGWYSMLFAAGTGVGLLFYGVAEPVAFYAAPPFGEPQTPQAARDAMVHSFFHWGLHGWSLYGLMGLALGFFCYNRGLPLTVRSAFYPLLGERVHGTAGNLIDVMAVAGTLFGVAVSLGLGVQQINVGLAETFGAPSGTPVQVGLIAAITAVATVSVITGLARGIQWLSKLALVLGGLLVLYVLVVGPTRFLLDTLLQNTGMYLQQLPSRGTYLEGYQQSDWQNQWTLFYFAWWISWSPFVGMFIARVSRGRTLREYLLSVLLVPTAASIVWLTVMGGSALHQEMFGDGGIITAIETSTARGTFALLSEFPVPPLISLATMTLIILTITIFFVTSSDSGSLVIDIMTSGGDRDPPTATRVFWAILEGVVAAILLIAGGLKALQSVATVAGLPFAAIILVMCLSLYLGLRQAHRERAGVA